MTSFNQAYATKVGRLVLFVFFYVLIAFAGVMVLIPFIPFSDWMLYRFGSRTPVVTELIAVIGLVLTAVAVRLAALQVKNAQRSQYTAFITDYTSKIFRDEEFVNTFHYLVYTYTPDVFREVKDKLENLLNERESTDRELQEEMYRRLEHLQDRREEGCRFYHPALFQGSVEERRLDSLLGYLNYIAYVYYNERELITQEDIEAIFGYHLDVIVGSTVVQEYFDYINEVWSGEHTRRFGKRHLPFRHLMALCCEWRQMK